MRKLFTFIVVVFVGSAVINGNPEFFKNQVSYPEFAAAIGLGIEALYETRSGGKRWADATPSYTLMADILGSMFPAAKFLHILRDGRAVVNSMSTSGFSAEWASNFETACDAWAHYATVGRRFQADNPARALEVRYENLVADPNTELRRVFEFLGEEHCEKSAELIATKRINSSYGNKEAGDIRKIKSPASAPKEPWRVWSSGQKAAFRKRARAAMKAFGYEIDS